MQAALNLSVQDCYDITCLCDSWSELKRKRPLWLSWFLCNSKMTEHRITILILMLLRVIILLFFYCTLTEPLLSYSSRSKMAVGSKKDKSTKRKR